MDSVKIILPCGFQTTFGCLPSDEEVIRCMMCDEEDLNIQDVLERPVNRLRLKEKKLELKFQDLQNLSEKLTSIKRDPRFFVESSFEKILNELDLRREEIKQSVNTQIDEHYMKLRKNLEVKKIWPLKS